MPRALKVFQTHIGFYDLIVAAPSMAAAAKAWGANVRIFGQGFASRIDDKAVVQAAIQQPGVVLKRPHGTKGAYKADADPVPVPKRSAANRAQHQKAVRRHKQEVAREKRERHAAEKQAKKAAAAELSDIEHQEAQLRARRQALQRKFHLRSVK
jgi:hypothetical protein